MDRKTKFKTACAMAGISANQFAKSAGVSQTLISLTLSNQRRSRRANQAIDRFIEQQFNKLRIQTGSDCQKKPKRSTYIK